MQQEPKRPQSDHPIPLCQVLIADKAACHVDTAPSHPKTRFRGSKPVSTAYPQKHWSCCMHTLDCSLFSRPLTLLRRPVTCCLMKARSHMGWYRRFCCFVGWCCCMRYAGRLKCMEHVLLQPALLFAHLTKSRPWSERSDSHLLQHCCLCQHELSRALPHYLRPAESCCLGLWLLDLQVLECRQAQMLHQKDLCLLQ